MDAIDSQRNNIGLWASNISPWSSIEEIPRPRRGKLMFCENVTVGLVMHNNCVNNTLTVVVVVVKVVMDVVGVVAGGHHGYAGHLRAPRSRTWWGPSHPLHHRGVHLNIIGHYKLKGKRQFLLVLFVIMWFVARRIKHFREIKRQVWKNTLKEFVDNGHNETFDGVKFKMNFWMRR